MNPARVNEIDLINFMTASQKVFSATEASRSMSLLGNQVAHDAYTRLLTRLEPDPVTLWNEVAPLVIKTQGVLIVDDSTLDKPYATEIKLVSHHWSGKHHRVVNGINLISMVWSDGDRMYPCDYRVYDQADSMTKNDHAQAMWQQAKEWGFEPEDVLFDSWYASIDNVKTIQQLGWKFLTRMKVNRKVRINRAKASAVSEAMIDESGTVVWLPEFGEVKVFRVVDKEGNTEHWLTNDLMMTELSRVGIAERGWQIEEYHRGLKQHCGVERCRSFKGKAQRNYIRASLRAFVRLEWIRYSKGITWFETKMSIIREAVADYLRNPTFQLPNHATA